MQVFLHAYGICGIWPAVVVYRTRVMVRSKISSEIRNMVECFKGHLHQQWSILAITAKTKFSITFVEMNKDEKLGVSQNQRNFRHHIHQHEERLPLSLVSVEAYVVVFVLACRSCLVSLFPCCLNSPSKKPVSLSHPNPSTRPTQTPSRHLYTLCQFPRIHADVISLVVFLSAVVPTGSLETVLYWPVGFTRLSTDGDWTLRHVVPQRLQTKGLAFPPYNFFPNSHYTRAATPAYCRWWILLP